MAFGGRTTNARGMLMRCGEQLAHTTRPQRRQWWRRLKNVNGVWQSGQLLAEWSGCQTGRRGGRRLLVVVAIGGLR